MRVLVSSVFAGFLLTACMTLGGGARMDASAVRAGASAMVEEWARSGSEGRWDDLVALYADEPGFAWIEQGEARYPDHAAVVAGVRQAAQSGMSIRTTATNIVATPVSDDAAGVQADVAITFGDPARGGFAFTGMLTGLAVKREGRWIFLQGHLASPAAAVR